MSDRAEQIRAVLKAAFKPISLNIIDESWKHAGHAGAQEQGGGHFVVEIISEQFSGKPRIQRHRMVNHATTELFGPTIHALNIKAYAPDEKSTE
ncbi:MAG TPA: BolA family protein [Mariprofundaceae bacterium]|nr:BolA family protein [Mariprofundaceae bacterium]